MTPCGYFKLLAEFDWLEDRGDGIVDGECKVNATRYVEISGNLAGQMLGRVCAGHDAQIRQHPGFASSTELSPQTRTADERRCHRCGATSGLRRLIGSPLSLDGPVWKCADGCPKPAESDGSGS